MRKFFLSLSAIFFLLISAMSQNRTISGKVSDQDGAPLQGVTVASSGRSGVTTNAEGNFTISLPRNSNRLTFSFVGFLPQTITVSSTDNISVTLKQDQTSLQDVIVTAFGIKKSKKDLGYDATQLSNDEVTRAHTTNVSNALGAKIPGVIVSGSGGPFTGSSITIRGNITFQGSNQPLYVVDGLPINTGGGGSPLQSGPTVSNRAIDINSEDIESMTVLKGPSAAALYGSNAANGVIVITTKKGKFNQKGTVQFSSSYTIDQINRLPDYQNQYAQGFNGVYNNSDQRSWGPLITGQTVTNSFGKQEILAAYPNNVKDIFVNGETFQNNVSFTGGSQTNSFRFSYGNTNSTAIIPNNRLIRQNFSISTNSKISSRLSVSVSGNYVINTSKRTQQGNQLSNPVFRAYFTPRSYDLTNLPFEDAAGGQTYFGGEDNPYWTIKNNRFNDEINRFFGIVGFNYKFTNWLQFDYKIGTDIFSTFRHGYDQIAARGGANTSANGVGGVLEVRNQFRSFNSNGFFTATKRFHDFSFTGIVGNEIGQSFSRTAQIIGYNVVVRDFEQLSNTTQFFPSNGSSKLRLIGVYGDFAFGYKSIANLNVTLRNDWSSTFKKEHRSYLYPTVGGSLNLTELLPAIKGNIIDNIKLKGNISKIGKAGDFVYATDSYFAGAGSADGFGPAINFPFNSLVGFTLSNAAGNELLGPEFTTNKEIGADISLFKNRFTIEATTYKEDTKDIIFFVPVPATTGITSAIKNAGKSNTKGLELRVILVPLKSKDFNWTIDANYTKFKTIVKELAPGVANIFLGGFVTPNIRLVAGDEYGQIYGNAYKRDSATGKIIVNAAGLPLITTGVQKIGNPNPKFTIGITNTFTYKDFSLSVLLDIKHGGDQYSRNIADLRRNGVAIETADFPRYDANGVLNKPYIFDAVYATSKQPDTTHLSAQDYYGNSGKYAAAEGFIVETSWFRVREAALTYRMQGAIMKKLPISSAEFSVFGRNLFLHTPHYPHLDPEQNALGISNARGLEFNALPQTRSMGVSLKITF